MQNDWNVAKVRERFPALSRTQNGRSVVFFDGPAGSQVPQTVADAVASYLLNTNANVGAPHETSTESDAILQSAHRALADFLGADDPVEVCFGANMTTITLAVSRALSRHWNAGDEIIVTRLDHDANVTPWILAAKDAGAVVRHVELSDDDWSLDMDDFYAKLNRRTRLVAVGYASNATGTINPVQEIIRAAHDVGALTYIDAVHAAPHVCIDVSTLQCDFLVCSAYKFFGPHVGVLYGRRSLLEELQPYKLRPATDQLPGKWMTGTQNHEGIAGATAAVNYLAGLSDIGDNEESAASDGRSTSLRRRRLDDAFRRITDYEQRLSAHFLSEVGRIPGVRVHGIADPGQLNHRVPTFSLTFDRHSPSDLAEKLAGQGIYCWAGNHYALPFTEAAGLEPEGTLRIGALHYNTPEEIDRTLHVLRKLTTV